MGRRWYMPQIPRPNNVGSATSGGVPITPPTSISNLVYWGNFEADNITESGGLVSQMDDLSGNGYNFTQGGAAKPAWSATPPTGQFRGSDLLSATLGASNFSAWTWFGRINVSSVIADSTLTGATTAASESTGSAYVRFGANNRLSVWVLNVGEKCLVDLADALVAGTTYRIVVTYNSPTFTIYINNVAVKTDTQADCYFPYRANIGKAGSFSDGDVDFGDNGLYSRVLTSGERAQLDAYLSDGYSAEVSISTPSSSRWVYQRNASNQASVPITGTFTGSVDQVRARLVVRSTSPGVTTAWSDMTLGSGTYSGSITAAAGWYDIEVEAYRDSVIQGDTNLERVGVGEVFVTAGQSLAVNFGQTEHTPTSDMVNAISASQTPILAADPQPNDSTAPGTDGSCWADFGDFLVDELNVPVLMYSVGCGNTASAEWLPSTTPHYDRLATALQTFGSNGCRAVLWQQGESDTATSQATYESNLTTIINESRTDAGWTVPWLLAKSTWVAGVTLPNVQAAYAELITDLSEVYAGADTDTNLDAGDRQADNTHPDDAGQTEQGQLWGQAVIDAFELAVWDPSLISGAIGYWDAELDVTLNGSGVETVGNQVSGGPDATQSTSGRRMTMSTQDGDACFLNDGVDDELNVTLVSNLTAHSKWAIINITASAAFDLICGSETGNGELNFEMSGSQDVNCFKVGDAGRAGSSGDAVPHNQTLLVIETYDGTTVKHYNGVTEIGSESVASGSLKSPVNWFGSTAFESLQGKIKAFGLSSSGMSSGDRALLYAWAQDNKGVA